MNNPIHTFVILAYKESDFLEACIKSVINQVYKSKVIMATTTDNQHIRNLAKKYNLDVIVGKHTNIGGDFDFAISATNTPLVTIAHQDDIYEKSYSDTIIKNYQRYPDSAIIFTDYFEIRAGKKIYTNALLKIKRILLTPLRPKIFSGLQFNKRLALKFGDPICCPAVTFVTKNCPSKKIFSSSFKSNVDWHAWEKLSRHKGRFTFISQPLMGHRISAQSTTTDIINQGIRTKEDYEILCRLWPKPIAQSLTKIVARSEKSNQL